MAENASAPTSAPEQPDDRDDDQGERPRRWWEGSVKILTAATALAGSLAALINAVDGLGLF